MSEVELKWVDYSPGDKWSYGRLEFEFSTPLGSLVYKELIPGPRHGDGGEVTVELGGVNLSGWVKEFDGVYPEFEAPGNPGRWAEAFEAGVEAEVESTVKSWFEASKEELADFLAQQKKS